MPIAKRKASLVKGKPDVSSSSTPTQEVFLPESSPQKRKRTKQGFMKMEETLFAVPRVDKSQACFTPKTPFRFGEAHDGSGSQRSRCSHCAHVSDISSWVPVDPKVSRKKYGPVTFSLSSASGRYQCTRSGLRWVCTSKVSLQYHYATWGQFREELAKWNCRAVGSLMDIKVLSGKIEEIHLPHFVCIGDSEDVKHAMKILHGPEDGKVSLENCVVTRFHAKFLSPSFSPMGPVMKENLPVLVHIKLLHYRPSATSLIQRTYLIPDDSQLEDKVSCQEEKCNSIQILTTSPDTKMQMGDTYSLSTTPRSTVTPKEMTLRGYDATPNFYKVVMKQVRPKITMKLTHVQDNVCVWKDSIHKEDFSQTTALTNTKTLEEAAQFVDRNRLELIKIKFVEPIAEEMLSNKLINDQKLSEIIAHNTSEKKMRCVYDCLRTVGCKGKSKFYEILQKHEPLLIDSLNDPQ